MVKLLQWKRVRNLAKYLILILIFLTTNGWHFGIRAMSANQQKPVITWWCQMSSKAAVSVTDYSQLGCYQLLMKKFNVKLQFIHPPLGSNTTDQFNLMIASKKLPDIIEYDWLNSYPGGPQKAIVDKVIVPLTPYIEKYALNFKKYLNSHPDIKKMIVTDEGDFYCFPFIRENEITRVFAGPQIRKDWLDKLKLDVPETVDEWYRVLKAFKNNQEKLNGNKALIYPFSGYGKTLRQAWGSHFLIGAWGITLDFYIDGGKVKYGPLSPNYKEFIKTLQRWWKEGLIDPDMLMQDISAFQAKVLNDQIGSYTGGIAGEMGKFLQAKKGSSFDLIGAPFPVLKKGQKPEFGSRQWPYPGNSSAAITSTCKNIPLAVKILDWGYSKEGYRAYNFGIEGKSYVIKNGAPVYTDTILKDPKLPIAEALHRYARAPSAGPFVQAPEYALLQLALPQQLDAFEKWKIPKNERVLPPITLKVEESREIGNFLPRIQTYYDEMFSKLVIGKDNNFDAFVKTLKKMGIEKVLKIYQQAYERYMKRAVK